MIRKTSILVLLFLASTSLYSKTHNTTETTYINTARQVGKKLEAFVLKQKTFAEILAQDPSIKNALLEGNHLYISTILKKHFAKNGIFENIFITTASNSPVIIAAAIPQTVGLKGKGLGYDDNFSKAKKGITHISRTGLSPVTKFGVVLITIPVYIKQKVRAIIGLSVNLGTYTQKIITKIKIEETGYILVADKSGLVINHVRSKFNFRLDLSKFNFGKRLLYIKSGEVGYYEFSGKRKIAAVYTSKLLSLKIIASGYVESTSLMDFFE